MAIAIGNNKLPLAITKAGNLLSKTWQQSLKILSFSPAHDRIYPARCIVLSIDKGAVYLAYGVRIFGKTRIKKNAKYDLSHEEFPKPAEITALLDEVLKQWGIKKADVELQIPKSWVIIKDEVFPVSVKDNISNVIKYELDRITPLNADEAYYDFTITGHTSQDITVTVTTTKSSAINPYLDALKEAGFKVAAVLHCKSPEEKDQAAKTLISYLNNSNASINLLSKGLKNPDNMPLRFTIAITLIILTLITLYLASPIYIETNKLQQIEAQVKSKKPELKAVEALKKEVEKLNNEFNLIEDFKNDSPKSLDMIKELTAIIPKNTWLTRIRITKNTVEIEGYAETTSGLLPALENSKYFSKAEFASPTFKDMSLKADRFVIKMLIEGAQQDKEQKK